MNKPKMHNNTRISSFQNGLNNHPLRSTGLYFKSKIMEGSQEVKK